MKNGERAITSKKESTNLKGASALFGAAMTYASFGILIREMSKMFGDNAQVAFRFVLALIFLVAYGLIVKKPIHLPREAKVKAAALGFVFGALVLLFTIAVTNTTIANAVFLAYAGSIISSFLIGTFVLKEKLGTNKILAIALAMVGLMMYSNAILALTLGVVTALCTGLLDGVANGIRKTLKGYDRNAVLKYQFIFGSVFALVMLMFSSVPAIKQFSLMPLLAGILFAALQISLGNLLLYGFQHFDVNVGTVILATEILFATILGFVIFREVPARNEIIGGLTIFAASILSAVDLPRRFKKQEVPSLPGL